MLSFIIAKGKNPTIEDVAMAHARNEPITFKVQFEGSSGIADLTGHAKVLKMEGNSPNLRNIELTTKRGDNVEKKVFMTYSAPIGSKDNKTPFTGKGTIQD